MNEENKRKTIILTFIGALTLLFVVVGGTFAFFQIVNTDEGETSSTLTGETEGLTKYGTPTLTQGTSNLHINLKASDMGYSKKGTSYWATNVEANDYEIEEQQHIISTAKIIGAESEDTELSCTSELTIKASGTILEDTNPLVEEDGYVYLGSANGGSNKVSINPTQIDLKQIIDKSMGEGVGYQTEISYTIKGNTGIDITVDIDIINRDANQNTLSGAEINFIITNKNISCSVKEKEDKAYMVNLYSRIHNKASNSNGGYFENINFVNYIPERNSVENIGIIDFVDMSDIESGTLAGSVVAWSVKNNHKGKNCFIPIGECGGNDLDLEDLYIGSKSTIYAKDLSWAFSSMPNLKNIDFSNLNTSETTNMSYMFNADIMQGRLSYSALDLSSFDTSQVTDMSGMFAYCDNLDSIDLSSFTFDNVTNVSSTFQIVPSSCQVKIKSSQRDIFERKFANGYDFTPTYVD